MLSRLFIILLALVYALGAFAANLAIIDSGLDYKHIELKDFLWKNPSPPDIKDVDGKTYKDVQYGWNFAENNNLVIDYKHLGTFSSDCKKIFQVQAKILKGTATEDEKEWYKQKKSDPAFLKELARFGNFVHGTHVAGIAAYKAQKAQLVAQKIIPTGQNERENEESLKRLLADLPRDRAADNPLAKFFLMSIAKKQGDLLGMVSKFVAAVRADIANGSFGTSVPAVAPLMKQLLPQLLGKEPTEEEVKEYSVFFVEQISINAKQIATNSPKTLFVFAAGNDGTNNDEMPVSPANVKADNTISVAATNGTDSLAIFSNYGVKMVEVAAPGVAIPSTIPGDETLAMSGTSMAAPVVANAAGLVKDQNPALAPKEIKQILMDTVDKKDFLKGKVVSGGLINRTRALKAAQLSLSMPVSAAIATALRMIGEDRSWSRTRVNEADLVVLPLPALLP